ncbi:MAG: hypothetical protein IT562_20545 [Alphaproteobacteria bacterium]|nr:hypothetical protein [Alphaproteobacteria bacterium]
MTEPGAEPKHPRTSIGRFMVSLRFSMLTVSLVTVLTTAAAVHFPWTWISRANIGDMAGQLNAEIIGGISREIDRLFDSTVSTQAALEQILATNTVALNDPKRRNQLLFALLRANPHFSWVSFGAQNGDFFGAQRREDRSYRVVESSWDADLGVAQRREDYYVGDDNRIFYTQTKTKDSDYYSPARQWYHRAIANPQKHVWTDVYIFSANGKPGINTSIALDVEGQRVGVVSIAIELDRISRYLRELTIARRGEAFIVSQKGEMIAFRDVGEVSKVVDGDDRDGSTLKQLKDSHHPALVVAREAMAAAGVKLESIDGPRRLAYMRPGSGERYFVTVTPANRLDWLIATVIPESDFLAGVDRNLDQIAYTVLGVVLFIMALSMVVARVLFLTPLSRMIEQTRLIERFDLNAVRPIDTRIKEIASLSGALVQTSRGLAAFRKYIATDLVRDLLAKGVGARLGGERRTLTILFMDLAGFTTLTERMGHRLLPYLSAYLSGMTRTIMENRGTIDKFIGDAVMAFWGAPAWNENHAVDACRSALECVAVMNALREKWRAEGRPDMYARIGVNTGRVVVGNIGSDERLDYTVIGDPVNLASRLEGMNKVYGTSIIIGHNTYEEAKYDIVVRRLDAVQVKGREEPVFVYELLDMADPEKDIVRPEWVQVYESALDAYADRDWTRARDLFRRADELRPGGDPPAALFVARCEAKLAPRLHDGKSDFIAAAE